MSFGCVSVACLWIKLMFILYIYYNEQTEIWGWVLLRGRPSTITECCFEFDLLCSTADSLKSDHILPFFIRLLACITSSSDD